MNFFKNAKNKPIGTLFFTLNNLPKGPKYLYLRLSQKLIKIKLYESIVSILLIFHYNLELCSHAPGNFQSTSDRYNVNSCFLAYSRIPMSKLSQRNQDLRFCHKRRGSSRPIPIAYFDLLVETDF